MQAYETAAAAIRASLRGRGQLGFGDVRSIALERLKDTIMASRITKALTSRFLEIIVDEAQDCNPDDLKIIEWLRGSGLTVKIVCDPHQSIYEFRGGVTDELLTFSKNFHENERKQLTGNFRSAPNICKAIAQFRSLSSRTIPDEPIGQYKSDTTPIHILSYTGAAVPPSIGVAFCNILKETGIDFSLSPIIAATKDSGAAAIGKPRHSKKRDRSIRLADAVTGFHFAAGFNDMKKAIDEVHKILLELEGLLDECSYQQYLENNEIDVASWRPRVLFLLRELRFDSSRFPDARAWHGAAKDLLTQHLTLGARTFLSQRFRWNQAIADSLVPIPNSAAMPRTIHSVKGMQFPAVCVVTTASTLKSILDYLETGEPLDKAEDARKLYVAASRAERLLVIAAPKSQAKRLKKHLATQGAEVEIKEI